MPVDARESLFWWLFTRLGEIQLVAPALMIAAGVLAWTALTRRFAMRWAMAFAVGALLVLASKLAFIGWGMGNATLDFTGISGHAFCAASFYPLLARSVAQGAWRRPALITGWCLAAAIAASRLVLQVHSVSEVLAGFVLGSLVFAVATRLPSSRLAALPWAVPAVIAGWLAITPSQAPASPVHDGITRWALKLSGRSQPYTRDDLQHHRPLSPLAPSHRVKVIRPSNP